MTTNTKSRDRRRQAQSRRARQQARLRLLAGAAVVVVVVVVAVIATASGGDRTGSTDALAFDLPAIQGDERIRLADFRGEPVVVNFFASWCTACDAELPHFSKFSRELEGEVAFIGVAALETGDLMFMPERHDITWWPLARDIGGTNGSGLHRELGGRGMPITAFYDAEGQLLHVDGGALPEAALRDRLTSFYGVTLDA